MDFRLPAKRKREESIVPMINVVFLLLIFFLMTSQIRPPEPFEVTVPNSDLQSEPSAELLIYVSRDGNVQFETYTNETAWARLGGRIDVKTPVTLKVDAALPADQLAQVSNNVARVGATVIELIVEPK